MDSGAHFYRCEFQVHTPRDLNWVGDTPSSDTERQKYAQRFIAACRAKSLQAVAITDHHDVAFFRHIKEAAKNEVSDRGDPIAEEARIVVFPGIELTLGVPCQALLILDAQFPAEFLSQILPVLSISQAPDSDPKHGQVLRLEHFRSLEKLCDELDNRDWLRGHYVLLPNVGNSGKFSMLRKGMAGHYKDMPCVGGYVDGPLSSLDTGKRDILEGKAKEYASRKLAVVQTSDSRRGDFSELGRHPSWIKWAVPTAEALRQACLARDTRISNVEPQLPSLLIQAMEVSNSKFLGPVTLEFNPQLNCLIGGRGTGKSTILEYLRWTLCDQPPALLDEDELPDFQKKRANLIENTLVPYDAVVTVTFLLNSIPHTVRRNARSKQLLLKIGGDEFAECFEDTIRDLLGIQAYSQKQLSTVGVRTEELVRFIKTPIAKSLREFELKQDEIKGRLRRSYGQIQEKRSLNRELGKDKFELESLAKQVQTLRSELKGLSEEDKRILAEHDHFLEEEQVVNEATNTVADWRGEIDAVLRNINLSSTLVKDRPTTPNPGLIGKVQGQLRKMHIAIREGLTTLKKTISESGDDAKTLTKLQAEWKEQFKSHTAKYEAAKARASTHESRLKAITQTEQRTRTLKEGMADKERRLSKYGDPESTYDVARREWEGLYTNRADMMDSRCAQLTSLSKNRIRAKLRRGAGLDKLRDQLSAAMSGTRVRGKKVEDLCEHIASAEHPVTEWTRVSKELESLALVDAPDEGGFEIPACPALNAAGFTASDLERIARQLSVDSWLEVSLTELEDVPIFEYQQREAEYIKFGDASAGQQATALLRVLLNQEGPPLIIDQPEEDLDNPVILEIVREIWAAKTRRQILFTSHNANIVVNGDADLVVCCDYRAAGDQSGGRIKFCGAIDMPNIRSEITNVMEGGQEAFRLRKEKYGF